MKRKFSFLLFSILITGTFLFVITAKEARLCDHIYDVTYEGSIGTDFGVKVTCTTGGEYKCPLCLK